MTGCCFYKNGKEWIVDGCHLCFVSLSSHFRSSFVSDVFDFNISLNDAAPLSPMSLTIDAVPARICEESFVSQQCSIIILQN